MRLNQYIFQKILSKCSGKHDNMAVFMHSNIYSRRRKGSIPHIAALVTLQSFINFNEALVKVRVEQLPQSDQRPHGFTKQPG